MSELSGQIVEGGELVFNTGRDTAKGLAMAGDSRAGTWGHTAD
jgi:hypothetical protein